jgi:hypothetical protein
MTHENAFALVKYFVSEINVRKVCEIVAKQIRSRHVLTAFKLCVSKCCDLPLIKS